MTICHSCDPANPDRIFSSDADGWRASFGAHFNGPPAVVNGGVAVGSLACPGLELAYRNGASHPAAVRVTARLRRPIPVATELLAGAAQRDDGAIDVTIRRGEEALVVGAVRVADLPEHPAPGDALQPVPGHLVGDLEAMSKVALVEAGELAVRHEDHPFPACFSCGPANARGLRIFPRTTATNAVMAHWIPDDAFLGPGGALPHVIIGAALDCSNAMALSIEHEEMEGMRALEPLLAAFDMHVLRVPQARPPDAYRVVGRASGEDGRRKLSVSALFDASGVPFAVAETAWVLLPKGSFG